ncbi:MAG TPA: DUF2934 domain-containing protein [Spirochaetota bacterium]|jgi:hypothetical protein|nr:MAG: hypothetical protein BWX91_01733 [Spirochaetes bacterium ADurb.Bin133]HNZ26880.1 DUF2934 domain-containing protein [Spirochaetota bacterium]HOF01023.1 DUF2934 domain-containing protein [Spirochaetota bacterium]HOS32404.1 DUF2934 domain-containing protein [Spirochaetota bacterium]HOS55814.1 DUF2934 domain-containing protein [Spirochaetota bacterium]
MAKKTTSNTSNSVIKNDEKATGCKQKKSNVDLNQFLSEIEKRAYEIYEERKKNHIPGDDFTDWLQAQSEIKAKYKMI